VVELVLVLTKKKISIKRREDSPKEDQKERKRCCSGEPVDSP